ncbi:hypothetical protein DID78_02885 [Candidatus Marinamargulisbacteria bacterium SCGC AG-343-D04]|nr:hypothetical protein DID78_02885 [Candidatus Marinamargulisbacteria bacterium SCGC AG-343-D04]
MKRILLLYSLLFLTLLSVSFIEAKTPIKTSQIRYEYLGSFKAILGIPKGKGPFPVIIYSYDEFYDWAGQKLAEKLDYNLKDIAAHYTQKGFVTVIPLERYRKVNAITGVINTIKQKKYVQKNNIHLIGISEGAFMNILASQKITGVASISCIAPIFINNKGYLSKDFFLLNPIIHSDIPLYFLFVNDVQWRVQNQKRLYHLLRKHFKNISYKKYNVKKKWFWYSKHSFNQDINLFIMKHYNSHYEKSTNTY